MLKIETTKLDGVLLIKPDVFEDYRGQYIELYSRKLYSEAGISQVFIQDDISTSSRGVLRGLHGDLETWKLVSCLEGRFYLVVLNYDEKSPNFGKWQGFTLSETNRHQVLIPPLHGNGHVVMSERAIFHYKQTTDYDPTKQFTVRWDDPRFNIWWPVKNPILSQRDEFGHFVTP